jgi:hypothetical protein
MKEQLSGAHSAFCQMGLELYMHSEASRNSIFSHSAYRESIARVSWSISYWYNAKRVSCAHIGDHPESECNRKVT